RSSSAPGWPPVRLSRRPHEAFRRPIPLSRIQCEMTLGLLGFSRKRRATARLYHDHLRLPPKRRSTGWRKRKIGGFAYEAPVIEIGGCRKFRKRGRKHGRCRCNEVSSNEYILL